MQLLANTTSPFVRIARVALMEKGFAIEPTIVDPWADDPRLRRANVSARVPTLVLDDGRALSESLLIVQWLEAARPAPQWPSLVGLDSDQVSTVLSRAGIALGAIEASVHTIITRKVTAPLLFDETPVGLRRQRTMVESVRKLESMASVWLDQTELAAAAPTLDLICAVTLFDYQAFRYAGQPWVPQSPKLQAVAETMRDRPSFRETLPR
ncbi:MAG: glutathione S-transferase family protein [Betaproteobacteria bacterium]|nr:glutathione S-transferase family protein [Betaproteobacteria bacterium]